MNKKLLMIFIFGIFLISIFPLSSASISYEKNNQTYVIDTWIPDWLGGNGESTVTLESNTDYCLTDCGFHLSGYNEQAINLIDEINFKDYFGNDGSGKVGKLNFKLGTYQEVEKYNTTYKTICEEVNINNTNSSNSTNQICHQELKSNKTYYENNLIWENYEGQKVSGYWELKANAKKKPTSIDWIITFRGKELSDWAWWRSEWDYKRQINLTANVGNFSYIERINYSSGMQTNFDDVRFLNSAEDSELNFTIEKKVNSSYMVVRIFNAGSNQVYMYYGNSNASSASSASDVYFNPVSMYYLDGDATDSVGSNDGTVSGASVTTGKINQGYDFDGTDDYIDVGSYTLGTNPLSISLWLKPDSSSSTDEIFIGTGAYSTYKGFYFDYYSSGTKIRTKIVGSSTLDRNFAVSGMAGNWNHFVFTYDRSDYKLRTYRNGILIYTSSAVNVGTVTDAYSLNIGAVNGGSNYPGLIDEVGIWSRALTSDEVTELYSQTAPNYIVGDEELQKGIIINYITPPTPANELHWAANYLPIEVNVNLIGINFTNITYKLTNSNVTNVTFTNETYKYNFTGLVTDDYYFNVTVCGVEQISNLTICESTETRHIYEDALAPRINLTSPIGTYNYLYDGYNLSLIGTASDLNLDSCWYEYNNTNTTFSCSSDIEFNETFQLNDDEKIIKVYVNDTFGNIANETTSWNYLIFDLNNYTYNPQIVESEVLTIKGQFRIADDIRSVFLRYNGGVYSTSINSLTNNIYEFYSTIIAPAVPIDTNKTFNFIINGVETSNKTQLIKSVNLDNCGVYTNEVLNLTLKDEEVFSPLNGKIYVNFQIVDDSDNIIADYQNKDDSEHSIKFCSNINLTNTSLYLNAEIEYEAENYSREFYHIQKGVLNNYPRVINLYNIKLKDATEFKIIYQSVDLTKVPDAIVQLQRKYTYLDEYKIVEAPLTSSDSEAIVHVDTDSVKYKITISKDGKIMSTFDNLVFQCDNELYGICEQKLLEPIAPVNLISLENLNDFQYSIITNKTDRKVQVNFATPSATPREVNMVVLQKTIMGVSEICNKTTTSSAGSLICNYNDTIEDSNLILFVYLDGNLLAQKGYKITENLSDYFNGNNFLIVFIIGLSLIFMSMSSPEWIILNSVLTIIGAGALWLINGMDLVIGLGSLIWIIGAGIILILRTSKQEDN